MLGDHFSAGSHAARSRRRAILLLTTVVVWMFGSAVLQAAEVQPEDPIETAVVMFRTEDPVSPAARPAPPERAATDGVSPRAMAWLTPTVAVMPQVPALPLANTVRDDVNHVPTSPSSLTL